MITAIGLDFITFSCIYSAIISSISHSEIIVKLLPDHAKLRIYLSHLSKGKYTIKKKN